MGNEPIHVVVDVCEFATEMLRLRKRVREIAVRRTTPRSSTMNERIQHTGAIPPSRLLVVTKTGSNYVLDITNHTWVREDSFGQRKPFEDDPTLPTHGTYETVFFGTTMLLECGKDERGDDRILRTTRIVEIKPLH